MGCFVWSSPTFFKEKNGALLLLALSVFWPRFEPLRGSEINIGGKNNGY